MYVTSELGRLVIEIISGNTNMPLSSVIFVELNTCLFWILYNYNVSQGTLGFPVFFVPSDLK